MLQPNANLKPLSVAFSRCDPIKQADNQTWPAQLRQSPLKNFKE